MKWVFPIVSFVFFAVVIYAGTSTVYFSSEEELSNLNPNSSMIEDHRIRFRRQVNTKKSVSLTTKKPASTTKRTVPTTKKSLTSTKNVKATTKITTTKKSANLKASTTKRSPTTLKNGTTKKSFTTKKLSVTTKKAITTKKSSSTPKKFISSVPATWPPLPMFLSAYDYEQYLLGLNQSDEDLDDEEDSEVTSNNAVLDMNGEEYVAETDNPPVYTTTEAEGRIGSYVISTQSTPRHLNLSTLPVNTQTPQSVPMNNFGFSSFRYPFRYSFFSFKHSPRQKRYFNWLSFSKRFGYRMWKG